MLYSTYNLKETFVGRFPYNSDLLKEINKFCIENNITTGQISIIGAVKKLSVGFYLQNEKRYISLDKIAKFADKPMEIVSCSGNISIKDNKPFAHVHIIGSDFDGATFGGHLTEGAVVFAAEFIIHSFEGKLLRRGLDEQTRLPLWEK